MEKTITIPKILEMSIIIFESSAGYNVNIGNGTYLWACATEEEAKAKAQARVIEIYASHAEYHFKKAR